MFSFLKRCRHFANAALARAARWLGLPKLKRQISKPAAPPSRRPLTHEECELILSAARLSGKLSLRNTVLMRFLLITALRTIEVQRARWEDVTRHPEGHGATLRIWAKGRKGRDQEIHLSQELLVALESIRGQQWPGPHLFNGYKQGPLRTRSIRAVFDRLERAAALTGLSPHCLRHTAATAALEGGQSMEAVTRLLRHENPNNTLIYTRWAFDRLKAVGVKVSWWRKWLIHKLSGGAAKN